MKYLEDDNDVLLKKIQEPNNTPILTDMENNSFEKQIETILDFEKLEYISSAGLRVLLIAQKAMNKQGSMVIKNVNDVIMEVFEVTGFSDILTIE